MTVAGDFEPVHTVTDYYDGPRGGVADFLGVPHVYRSLWLDVSGLDSDEDRFELSPISRDALALVREDWAIWQRFEHAYHAGAITVAEPIDEATWGALPEELARYRELRAILNGVLAIDPTLRLIARAEFRVREPVPDLPRGVMRPLEVRWSTIE